MSARVMVHGDLYGGASESFVRSSYWWRGRLLVGQHAHWCPEWDDLPIDETCPEWPCACRIGDLYGRSTTPICEALP